MRYHHFRDEEYAGVHPEVSSDTERYREDDELFFKLRKHFDNNVYPFYTPDRNTALALSLSALTNPDELYACSSTSYVSGRGYAAIKNISGINPLGVPSDFGKISPVRISDKIESLDRQAKKRCSVISISQPTEYGTVYSPEEIAGICGYAHEKGMSVHMDGSRIFFATARILKAFRMQTLDAGVDVATFGGAKNGAPRGEAVLIFRSDAAGKFRTALEKNEIDTSGAVSFSSGLNRLLTERLWRYNAIHANEMAGKLAEELSAIPGIRLVCGVETNKVIIEANPEIFQRLKENYSLKSFRCPGYTVRFVTNYTTLESDIKRLKDILQSEDRIEEY